MKPTSSELLHTIENQLGLLISSIEAMEANIDDPDYCKEVIQEIRNKKVKFATTLDELKKAIGGIQ